MFIELKDYIENKPVNFILDIIISVIVITILFINFFQNKRSLIYLFVMILSILIGIASVIFTLEFTKMLALFITVGMIINAFSKTNIEDKRARKKITINENTIDIAENKEELIDTLVSTITYLASRQIGAIITFERNDSLNSFIDKSVKIDAFVSSELIKTIFFPNTALHDGAVIIKDCKVACACAYYPLTDKTDIPSSYGTRHRAAIGISEETDALSIVISEETGLISYTLDGTITTGISEELLKNILEKNLFEN